MIDYKLDAKEAKNKFFDFLKLYVEEISNMIFELENKLEFYENLKSFVDSKDVNKLKNNEHVLYSKNVYDSLIDKIEINDLMIRINEVMDEIKVNSKDIINIRKILSNESIDNKVLFKLLDSSNLNDHEKVLTLYEIFNSSSSSFNNDLIIIDVEEEELIKKYNKLKDKANRFYEKYSYLIDKDDDNTKNTRKKNLYYIQMLVVNINAIEMPASEKMAILMYKLKSTLLEDNDKNMYDKSEDEILDLNRKIPNLSSWLELGKELEKRMRSENN